MALPEAIQNQVAEAEAVQQQLYGQASDGEPVEQPAAPVDPVEPAPVEPQVAEPVAQEVKPDTVKAKEDTVDYWKSRFETVRGKLDTELPDMQRKLREQNSLIADMQARLEQAQKAPEPKQEDPTVTDKDVEDFGSDLVDMVKRASRAESGQIVNAAINELKKELGAMLQQLGAVQERVQMSEADKFWLKVKTLVPDWDTVDADENWISFLDTSPEYTTESYREMAAKAIMAGKAEAVAKLVDVWRGPAQVPETKPTEVAPNPELQRQVVPPTVKSSAPPQPTGKVLSKAEYEALYDPRNVQRYGTKKAEEMILQADLAVAEGRVRW